MTRPIRPVALVILTAAMIYPGVTMLYQGLYPFVTGEYFNLVARQGVWMELAAKWGIPLVVPNLVKAGLGGAWIAGVLGLWAGDWKAYPLALLAAAGTLLYPGGGMVMAVLALICLLVFREGDKVVPA